MRLMRVWQPAPRLPSGASMVLRYLGRTGLFTAVADRPGEYLATGGLTGSLSTTVRRHNGFDRKYTVADVALLAETDAVRDTLSGPATKHLMQRPLWVFGDSAMRGSGNRGGSQTSDIPHKFVQVRVSCVRASSRAPVATP